MLASGLVNLARSASLRWRLPGPDHQNMPIRYTDPEAGGSDVPTGLGGAGRTGRLPSG